jgi:hypothetical protein
VGPIIAGGPWTSPTYADSTFGDNVDGEDLDIRRAAVDALGQYNGSVVVVDPFTGRVLTMVNQKVALSSGFQPCSTVKVSVALAALSEKVIQPETKYRLGGMRMDLTYALAHSNNYYFATLGEKLGFERVAYYARLFGYGEKAGLNIADQFRRGDPADPAAAGCADECDRQRRHPQLPAISTQPGGSPELRAARQTAPGHRERDSDGEARDAGRGGIRDRPSCARGRGHRRQNRNLQ